MIFASASSVARSCANSASTADCGIGVHRAGFRHRFEPRAAQLNQVARERDERDRIDRLAEKRGGAELERFALQFFLAVPGDHHDRRRSCCRGRALR